jgi:hypothetical protein
VVGEQPRGRACRQADRLARFHEGPRRARDRLLLLDLLVRLRLEAGLVRARPCRDGRPAVHLVDETGAREHVEIPPDGHVGHAEQLRQLADARGTGATDFLQDQLLTLLGEHLVPLTISHRIEQGLTRTAVVARTCETRACQQPPMFL